MFTGAYIYIYICVCVFVCVGVCVKIVFYQCVDILVYSIYEGIGDPFKSLVYTIHTLGT